ncbi:MAG: hypothetical protein N2A42_09585 [Luteolibacter sp.]
MKILCTIALVICLASCNTSIGVWRDTKATFHWSKEKIQGSEGGEQEYEYGAPVY